MKFVLAYFVNALLLAGGAGMLWKATRWRPPVEIVAAPPIPGRVVIDATARAVVNPAPVLARNLFNASRRPRPVRQVGVATAASSAVHSNIQLVGLIQNARPLALVRGLDSNPGRTTLLGIGDSVAGVHLLSVIGDTVVFLFAADTLSLTLVNNE